MLRYPPLTGPFAGPEQRNSMAIRQDPVCRAYRSENEASLLRNFNLRCQANTQSATRLGNYTFQKNPNIRSSLLSPTIVTQFLPTVSFEEHDRRDRPAR